MDIHQVTYIESFYSQFLAQIRFAKINFGQSNKIATEIFLTEWLMTQKKKKTFGETCRHEISYMLIELVINDISNLERKILNMKENCMMIKIEMESERRMLDVNSSLMRVGS